MVRCSFDCGLGIDAGCQQRLRKQDAASSGPGWAICPRCFGDGESSHDDGVDDREYADAAPDPSFVQAAEAPPPGDWQLI